MMHLIGHDFSVEVSSAGGNAYVTQLIDFWVSISMQGHTISLAPPSFMMFTSVYHTEKTDFSPGSDLFPLNLCSILVSWVM